ncbi:MAG: hypothetical protein Q4E75_00310 [bacterium]|nr:hypothetical protein [bacterium]
MKIIKIEAIWCSSCIIMKSRFNDIIKDKNIEVISLDYDTSDITNYNIGDILPVYIRFDNECETSRLIGEHTKEELERFLS